MATPSHRRFSAARMLAALLFVLLVFATLAGLRFVVRLTAAGTPVSQDAELVLSATEGPAPLEVLIDGPSRLRWIVAGCRKEEGGEYGDGGNALVVDWGDGSDPLSSVEEGWSCTPEQRRHVYEKPGTYVVRVEKVQDGMAEYVGGSWSGEAYVVVKRPPAP